MTDFKFDNFSPMRGGWNLSRMLVRKKLTDRKIEQYRKKGWYSEEFRQSRRELIEKKASKNMRREGSFLNDKGRLIYNPL